MCYNDKTFCSSPNCTNKCGRKLTDIIRAGARKAGLPLSIANFCGDKNEQQETKPSNNH